MIYTIPNNNVSLMELTINYIDSVNDIYTDFIKESYEYSLNEEVKQLEGPVGIKEKIIRAAKSIWERITNFFKEIGKRIMSVVTSIKDLTVDRDIAKAEKEGKPVPEFEYYNQDSFDITEKAAQDVYSSIDEISGLKVFAKTELYTNIHDRLLAASEKVRFNGNSWRDIKKCFPSSNKKTVTSISRWNDKISKVAKDKIRLLEQVGEEDLDLSEGVKDFTTYAKEIMKLGQMIANGATTMLKDNNETCARILGSLKEKEA